MNIDESPIRLAQVDMFEVDFQGLYILLTKLLRPLYIQTVFECKLSSPYLSNQFAGRDHQRPAHYVNRQVRDRGPSSSSAAPDCTSLPSNRVFIALVSLCIPYQSLAALLAAWCVLWNRTRTTDALRDRTGNYHSCLRGS